MVKQADETQGLALVALSDLKQFLFLKSSETVLWTVFLWNWLDR